MCASCESVSSAMRMRYAVWFWKHFFFPFNYITRQINYQKNIYALWEFMTHIWANLKRGSHVFIILRPNFFIHPHMYIYHKHGTASTHCIIVRCVRFQKCIFILSPVTRANDRYTIRKQTKGIEMFVRLPSNGGV